MVGGHLREVQVNIYMLNNVRLGRGAAYVIACERLAQIGECCPPLSPTTTTPSPGAPHIRSFPPTNFAKWVVCSLLESMTRLRPVSGVP